MTKQEIINKINSAITTNGQGNITGLMLNEILRDIVNMDNGGGGGAITGTCYEHNGVFYGFRPAFLAPIRLQSFPFPLVMDIDGNGYAFDCSAEELTAPGRPTYYLGSFGHDGISFGPNGEQTNCDFAIGITTLSGELTPSTIMINGVTYTVIPDYN